MQEEPLVYQVARPQDNETRKLNYKPNPKPFKVEPNPDDGQVILPIAFNSPIPLLFRLVILYHSNIHPAAIIEISTPPSLNLSFPTFAFRL